MNFGNFPANICDLSTNCSWFLSENSLQNVVWPGLVVNPFGSLKHVTRPSQL